MKLQEGDLILYKSNNIFGQLIRFFSGGKYIHSEIMGSGNWSYCVNEKGIWMKSYDQIKNADIMRPNYKNRHRAMAYANRELNVIKGYGFVNLMAFACIRFLRFINCRWFEDGRWVICSHFSANVLTNGGVFCKDETIPKSLFSPTDNYLYYDVVKIGEIK